MLKDARSNYVKITDDDYLKITSYIVNIKEIENTEN